MGAAVNYRVLLVDDEATIRSTMATILQNYGFTVHTVLSAQEAKNALSHAKFDLVLTDLNMESVSAGYEVAEFARQQIPQPTVVLFTGYTPWAAEWREHGASALIEKPASITTLLSTIDKLLHARPRGRSKNVRRRA